ncbi:lipase family protein [Rhodococcoides fascians]|uniref:lipase family protein n=1 Tax=Rhodococcoides fascians TaxID=1828 RepID=UPI00050C2512|nr:lipase family protein [Rhodococcus fascians]
MKLASIVTSGIVALALTLSVTPLTEADPVDFYTPPAQLTTGRPGDVIKTEPAIGTVIPFAPITIDANFTRIMYLSQTATGEDVAVTGTIAIPSTPWAGPGPRPTVVLAPGTQGMGPACAASKLLALGQEYEILQLAPLLAQGYSVAMTDYQGLGVPGVHPYLNRLALGHDVLNMARAAADFVAPHSRMGLWGYSEGGMAVAAAAEIRDTYAPDVELVGAYAGAPPASLLELAEIGDGSLLSGGLGWVVNGFTSAYPDEKAELLATFNDRGLDLLDRAQTTCIYGAPILLGPFTKTSTYTNDGRSVRDHLEAEPWRTIVAAQELGNTAPSIPMYVAESVSDDFVKTSGVDAMVQKWCNAGATVTYDRSPIIPILTGTGTGHALGLLNSIPAASKWMSQQFGGRSAGNCN